MEQIRLAIAKKMKHAFTIMELLIVLTILAVGIGLGLTNLNKIQTQTTEKTFVARLKQLQIAKQQYIQEFGRIEAGNAWNAARAGAGADQACYDLLKRYIERPIKDVTEVAPTGYVLTVPTTVGGVFRGHKSADAATIFSAADR